MMRRFLFAAIIALAPLSSPQSEEAKQTPANEQRATPHEQAAAAPIQPPPVTGGMHPGTGKNAASGEQQQENWADKAWRHWARRFFTDLKISDALVAIFTGLLALFTARLWIATVRLWDASEKHAEHLKASVEAARMSAEAAIAVETARLFVSRADFAVRGQANSDLYYAQAWAQVANRGRTPAIIFQCGAEIFVGPELPEKPDFRNIVDVNFGEVVLLQNETWELTIYPTIGDLSAEESVDLELGRKTVWLYGFVAFWDVLYCENRLGFCARWQAPKPGERSGRFIQWEERGLHIPLSRSRTGRRDESAACPDRASEREAANLARARRATPARREAGSA